VEAVELEDTTRSFSIGGRHLTAIEGITFRVPERQVAGVVGPSGSGKSTLLRVISGLLPPDRGAVRVLGSPVSGPDSRVGLVFQEPRLLPWRTALENVQFPLELAGWSRGRREARARELLSLVGLDSFVDALPDQLSGGMAQRVGVARALALDPALLLLDEPFGALDALTRDRLDQELLRLWELTNSTIVIVTHSIPEAVYLSDRVLVLSPQPGRVIADVPVDLPRPRSPGSLGAAGATPAALAIRQALEESAGVELAA
jgi:ABC-type nitrate/sulfonate/bicarbonate transport system ATPase subunit